MYYNSLTNKLGWAGPACFWNVGFSFLTTEILAMGGWLNSVLLFNSSCFFLFEILTASLACLVSGSLNLSVISILNFMSSPSWSLTLCLCRALSPLPFLNWLRCSAALVLAERAVSPSYTLSSPLSSQVSQISLYPTLLVRQGILNFSESVLHSMHPFRPNPSTFSRN